MHSEQFKPRCYTVGSLELHPKISRLSARALERINHTRSFVPRRTLLIELRNRGRNFIFETREAAPASVSRLATDLRRYIASQPILSCEQDPVLAAERRRFTHALITGTLDWPELVLLNDAMLRRMKPWL